MPLCILPPPRYSFPGLRRTIIAIAADAARSQMMRCAVTAYIARQSRHARLDARLVRLAHYSDSEL